MRTILVTGATGAIGSVLVRDLLEEQDTNVRLLLRARSAAHLEERVEGLRRFWNLGPDLVREPRLRAVAGDVTSPNLGLTECDRRRLSSEVTHLIHSAGEVRLSKPLDQARKAAVDSAREIASFANQCAENGRFEKLEVLSTVGVAGNLAGEVPERALHEPRDFRNTYEAAKAEAETVLLSAMAEGLPTTIHRPSMVVGDSRDGRIIQFQVFYYLCEFLSGRRTGGIVPDTGQIRLDIVPVDYVARAIQASSRRREAAGRVFHLCAGPEQAPEIGALAQRIHDFFVENGRRLRRLRPVPTNVIRHVLPVVRRFVPGRMKRSIDTLPYFLAYLDTPQTFANVRTCEFFEPLGLSVPPVHQYLNRVLTYYLSHSAEETKP